MAYITLVSSHSDPPATPTVPASHPDLMAKTTTALCPAILRRGCPVPQGGDSLSLLPGGRGLTQETQRLQQQVGPHSPGGIVTRGSAGDAGCRLDLSGDLLGRRWSLCTCWFGVLLPPSGHGREVEAGGRGHEQVGPFRTGDGAYENPQPSGTVIGVRGAGPSSTGELLQLCKQTHLSGRDGARL